MEPERRTVQQRFEAAVYTNDIEACVDALYDGALCTELMTYEPNPEAEGLNAPPLSVAARRGYVRMCKLLLVQGAKIDGVNDFGGTALRDAAMHGSIDLIDTLLDRGADINAAGRKGKTALIMAALAGNNGAVAHLIRRGANTDLLTSKGKKAGEFVRILSQQLQDGMW
eukprot:m.26478 g.26478  ORF g.26478 m.26478 type:complete len:169 (+) comp11763_c0_seq1:112-618(+)